MARQAASRPRGGPWWGLTSAFASFLLPGAGQLAAGRRRSGVVLSAVTLLVLLAALLAWYAPLTVLGFAITRTGAWVLLAVNVALFAYRAAAMVHAYHVGSTPVEDRAGGSDGELGAGSDSPRWAGAVAIGVLVLLGAVTAVPHVLAGYYLTRTHAVMSTVFVPEPEARPVVLPPAMATAEPGPVPKPEPEPDPEEDSADDEPEEVPLPPPPPNPWIEDGRLTVALIGSDMGPGRGSARTDAMLVATVDTRTGDAAVFSIDRYMRDFPVPSHIADVYDERCATGGAWNYINAMYTCATRRAPEQFAARYPDAVDPGAAALTESLSMMLGLHIDHYALVDMEGFVRVVDALGGAEIDVPSSITVRISPAHDQTGWRTFHIPSGGSILDGETALAFVRMRDPGDGPRMRRQRCLITSMAANTDLAGVLRNFGELTAAIEDHVATDIPISSLPDLLQVLSRVEYEKVIGVGFGPPTYRVDGHAPHLGRIHARVAQVLDDPEAALEEGRTTEQGEEVCS